VANTQVLCPDREILFAFSVGNLPDDEQERIAEHLSGCETCVATLSEFEGCADSLVMELRQSLPPDVSQWGSRIAYCGFQDQKRSGPEPANKDSALRTPHSALKGLDLRDYELLDTLGRGGMGEVYRSRDPGLGRDLALKVLRPERQGDRRAEQRFEQEARITGSLQHPGIVPVYNLGRLPDGRLYFTMKVVRGETFAEVLHRRGPRTPERRAADLAVFEKVCQTLAYAHSKRVIHRDLKPNNIMVGTFGEVQVMDWGLAKVLPAEDRGSRVEERGVTHEDREANQSILDPRSSILDPLVATEVLQSHAGAVLGTYSYMSPEQACGVVELLDERCDVFGLGALLCEVLTGQPPYTGPSGPVVYDRARRAELGPALEELGRCGADRELVELAKKCLAVDPSSRPRDAGEVAGSIGAYLAGVQERLREAERQRAAAEVRATEEHKRRRLSVALAGALFLFVLAGVGAAWVVQRQRDAAHARQRETEQKTVQALDRARNFLADGWPVNDLDKLTQARRDAQRAVEIAQSETTSDTLQKDAAACLHEAETRLARAEKNRALLDALLDVLTTPETATYVSDATGRISQLETRGVDYQYAAAFRQWGLDIDQTPVEQCVASLGDEPEPVVQAILAGLSGWMLERRQRQGSEQGWRHLFDVAEGLDPNGLRRQLRLVIAGEVPSHEEIVSGLTGLLLPWTGLYQLDRGPHWRRLLELRTRVDPATEPVVSVVVLAQACTAAGDWPGAEGVLRRGVASRPNEVVLHDALARLLLRQGRVVQAIGNAQAARALRPHLGGTLGMALCQAGRVDDGEAVLREWIRRQPNNPERYFYLGTALAEQMRLNRAEEAFRQAIALKPDYADAQNNLGVVLHWQNKLEAAAAACRKAIEINPDLAEAYCNLGSILRDQGKLPEAVAFSQKGVALRPTSAHGYNMLGNVLLGQKKWEAALANYRQAIALRPNYAEAYNNVGVVLGELKRPAEAEAACREAIKINPKLAQAYCNLGIALRELNKPEEAVAAYRQAIALKRDCAEAYQNLGVVLGEQRQFKEAEAVCRYAIALKPDYPEAHLSLGNLLVVQNRIEEAAVHYRQAVYRFPQHIVIRQQLCRVEYYLSLEHRLLACLAGKHQPHSPQESLALGFWAGHREQYRAAVRFYLDAFRADPNLAGNLVAGHRYFAACYALAAAGTSKDLDPPDNQERADLRKQALEWLRRDLEEYRGLVERSKEARPIIQQRLGRWLHENDLAAAHDPAFVITWPAAEQDAWRQFWAEVEQLYKHLGKG
jgi:serine/threonine-protein kinase